MAFEGGDSEQVETIKSITTIVNEELQSIFDDCHVRLIDFKLEFGLDAEGQVLLADEISPDTCRLWIKKRTKSWTKIYSDAIWEA